MNSADRFRGCMAGLAVGDALGTTVEFKARGSFPPLTDMVGGGCFKLSPGQWTDDTSMALCLGASLLECDGFDAGDQVSRYLRWLQQGYMSSTGKFVDVGLTVAAALARHERTGDPFSGPPEEDSAQQSEIIGSGYVVRSLEAALWCFMTEAGFDAVVLRAANLGDDADTTAAVAGQLAGAFHGASGIRASWLEKLALREEILGLGERLGTA